MVPFQWIANICITRNSGHRSLKPERTPVRRTDAHAVRTKADLGMARELSSSII